MSQSISNEEFEIPIDSDQDDSDSAYGDGRASSTTSLTESILQYRELHGRTFQNFKGVEYWGPNDDKQNEQLDIVHHMVTVMQDGELFLAPIGPAPQKVIDIGTGTGIWAIDFADKYPSAEVIGTDLSNIMPSFVPPNLRFELDDANLEWTYSPDTFDYVHLRYLIGAVNDWSHIYSEAYKCLKPGGWIEHMDFSTVFESDDGTVNEDNILWHWGKLATDAGKIMGKSFEIYGHIKEDIVKTGFVDVKEHTFKLPIGPWSSDKKMKELGMWNFLFFSQDVEAMCLFILARLMNWEHTEIQAYIGKMNSALRDKKTHSYYRATVVYGRKPEAAVADAVVA